MFEQIAEDHDPAEGTQEIPTKDEKGKPEVVTASQVGQWVGSSDATCGVVTRQCLGLDSLGFYSNLAIRLPVTLT